MFLFIMSCVAISVLMLTYHVEIATGEKNRAARTLALVAVGVSMGLLYVNHIAV